ncbi:MAG: hypothetical protein SCALA701_01260 [Candidatus Scalindua sp.]|nr:MAG: hypothetical protein SCALA701_01260 [Candidatus Scalindua sp.]
MANEFYLRTATERLSVLELARLIGYELNPGVAANTYLAFIIEDTPGAFGEVLIPGSNAQGILSSPPPVVIDLGVKVQSIPGPGEQAQTFETVEKIEARAEWNVIRARLTQPQELVTNIGSIVLQGIDNDINTGDIVLIIAKDGTGSVNRNAAKIVNVTSNEERKTTRVDLELEHMTHELSPNVFADDFPEDTDSIRNFNDKTELDEEVVQELVSGTWQGEDLDALIEEKKWSPETLAINIAEKIDFDTKNTHHENTNKDLGIYVFRKKAALFGYNAAKQPTYDSNNRIENASLWVEWCPEGEFANTMYLDNGYEEVVPGSFIAVQKQNQTVDSADIFKISTVVIYPRTAYGISSKTTKIVLPDDSGWEIPDCEVLHDVHVPVGTPQPTTGAEFAFNIIRTTTVYVQSEKLTLAEVPIETIVEGNILTCERAYFGLKKGQKIIVSGERHDLKGIFVSETMTINNIILFKGFTVLKFEKDLVHRFIRSTVTVNANVTLATHGETVHEVLGSGDTTQAFQHFTLRQPPLTYVVDTQTTLEIRVNDLLWKEVADFFGYGPDERIYITRMDDEGRTTVIFGDGKRGLRLPTGQENIKARYRKGIGLQGLVKANKISQLMTRPLGVKGATNPLRSTDADDRERLANARDNAPLTVLALHRIVSLKDYEDYAQSYAGIDKALATWSWDRLQRTVFLTVAGPNGATIEETIKKPLLNTLHKFGDPNVLITINTYQPKFFRLKAFVEVFSDYLGEKVVAEIKQTLRENFSFKKRQFGQPVYYSEVLDVIHKVKGVKAVDIDDLFIVGEENRKNDQQGLEARLPYKINNEFIGAELLTLDSAPIELGER